MSNQLPLFEDHPVHKSSLRITKAGDGLSEALDLEPQAMSLGDEACFVVRGEIRQVNHRSDRDGVIVVRQHTLEVSKIVPIDPATAASMIAAESERLARLRDERSGQTAIDDGAPSLSVAS